MTYLRKKQTNHFNQSNNFQQRIIPNFFLTSQRRRNVPNNFLQFQQDKIFQMFLNLRNTKCLLIWKTKYNTLPNQTTTYGYEPYQNRLEKDFSNNGQPRNFSNKVLPNEQFNAQTENSNCNKKYYYVDFASKENNVEENFTNTIHK